MTKGKCHLCEKPGFDRETGTGEPAAAKEGRPLERRFRSLSFCQLKKGQAHRSTPTPSVSAGYLLGQWFKTI